MVVNFFELTNSTTFQNAQFFDLYQQPEKKLGSDLLASERFTLRPGDKKMLYFRLSPEARFIGVTGGYRNLDKSIWRYILPITSGTAT